VYAVVLTHDAQLGLAELVYKTYASLWPGHPLTFRIPFNGSADGPALSYLRAQPDCELIPAPRSIGASVLRLLDGLPDKEWVFWCIDDRYPTSLDCDALAQVVAGLDSLDDADEVKLLRWKEGLTGETVMAGGMPFVVQAPGSRHRGFWHHHFVRAGTLRRVFGSADLAGSTAIHDVLKPLLPERRARRWENGRPVAEAGLFRGRALVPPRQLVGLGEPLVRGRLTRNGMEELRRWDCEIPPYPSVGRHVHYG
jgi:hypothetical protein